MSLPDLAFAEACSALEAGFRDAAKAQQPWRAVSVLVDAEEQAYRKASETLGVEASPEAAESFAMSRLPLLRNIVSRLGDLALNTEARAAFGAAQFKVLQLSGATTKRWEVVDDDHVRDSHVECSQQGPIPIDQPFINGLMHPGDPAGGAEEVCNCRCRLAWS